MSPYGWAVTRRADSQYPLKKKLVSFGIKCLQISAIFWLRYLHQLWFLVIVAYTWSITSGSWILSEPSWQISLQVRSGSPQSTQQRYLLTAYIQPVAWVCKLMQVAWAIRSIDTSSTPTNLHGQLLTVWNAISINSKQCSKEVIFTSRNWMMQKKLRLTLSWDL